MLGAMHWRLARLMSCTLVHTMESLDVQWVPRQVEISAAHPMGRNPVRRVGISPVIICSSGGHRPCASRHAQDSGILSSKLAIA